MKEISELDSLIILEGAELKFWECHGPIRRNWEYVTFSGLRYSRA